jgi:hypothetical protein
VIGMRNLLNKIWCFVYSMLLPPLKKLHLNCHRIEPNPALWVSEQFFILKYVIVKQW